jgi:hypothetical protein
MTAALTCQVYVDDTRLADTGADLAESAPTALAGLSVDWGRGNSVDQPDTTTCTFTVRDIGGDADFLGLLHTGHPVTVFASGDISTGGTPVDVAVDGGFETAALPDRVYVNPANAAAAFTLPAHGGARAVRIAPTGTGTARAYVGPAPFSADPAAWDGIPASQAGQSWTLQLSVRPAAAATTTVAPWLPTSPATGSAGDLLPGTVLPPNPAAWQPYHHSFTIDAPSAGTRVGVAVTISGLLAWTAWPGTWAEQTLTWRDLGTVAIDDLKVLAPPNAQRQVMVFSGRITDLQAGVATPGVEVEVTAVDWTADLANDDIGDVPWLVETLAARVNRILGLASTPVAAVIDPFPAALRVSWVDVDSQPVMDLLSDLAETADAVLWSAWHATGGFYLWYEDPALRAALRLLAIDPDSGLVEITGNPRPSGGVLLSACDVSNDLKLRQDVTDVVTRVDLTWLDQLLDDDGQPAPAETHVLVVDTAAEATFGVRRVGYSTQLITAADGTTIANRVLNRSRALGWHADGLTWDTRLPEQFDDAHRTAALDLLDGSRRMGAPLVISDMPAWAPAGETLSTYLEGGSYTYQGGRWILELSVSPSGATGVSTRWADLPADWTWAMFDPAIAWFQLLGTTTSSSTTSQEIG